MPDQIITIFGKPIAKARARFATFGGHVRAYSAQSNLEKRVSKEIRTQWKIKPLDCPVILHMTFLSPITKGSKKVVADMLNGITKHVKRPDLSNYIKFYEDVMIGIVFRDDSQVYEIEASKGYAQEAQTVILVNW